MTTAPVLRFRQVTVVYRKGIGPALNDVALEVGPGEGVALFGANGAGKTTLLRAAMALLHPSAGSVEVAGRSTERRGPEDFAGDAGFVFQHPGAQLFERTIRAELAFGPRQLGWPAERIDAAVGATLAELELTALADVHPYDLPEPTRRLVAFGTALVTAPRLLLLDEPTAGLDRASRALVERIVRDRRAAGTAVVAVTHDGEFALEALDRGLVLDHGRITAEGAVELLLGTRENLPALPPSARLARALELDSISLRRTAVTEALATHCRAKP